MAPASTGKLPATALSKVDLPDPLVPITITQEPSSIVRSTPQSAVTSFDVPGLNVLQTFLSSSIEHRFRLRSGYRLERVRPFFQLGPNPRQGQRHENKTSGDTFEIVGIEPPTQGDGDQQAEENRSHDGAREGQSQTSRPNQSFADDDARESPDHHADPHLDIGKSLVLRQQRPRQRNQPVGDQIGRASC